MPRPRPTYLYHFTHVHNLPGIVENGLLCDSACRRTRATKVEVGSGEIKRRRLARAVPIEPGGFIGDYVPFYFAPRSPMMYSLGLNNYEYRGGFREVVYLVTTFEQVVDLGLMWVVTDRNAAQAVARFVGNEPELDGHVDWPLMAQTQWGRTPDDPGRPDRRMAECLVLDRVPWEAFTVIATRTADAAADAIRHASRSDDSAASVVIRKDWYFD
jgi:hypothetical protein